VCLLLECLSQHLLLLLLLRPYLWSSQLQATVEELTEEVGEHKTASQALQEQLRNTKQCLKDHQSTEKQLKEQVGSHFW